MYSDVINYKKIFTWFHGLLISRTKNINYITINYIIDNKTALANRNRKI